MHSSLREGDPCHAEPHGEAPGWVGRQVETCVGKKSLYCSSCRKECMRKAGLGLGSSSNSVGSGTRAVSSCLVPGPGVIRAGNSGPEDKS